MKLPQHKHDTAIAAVFGSLSMDELAPHLPELLGWMQDFNWPVAKVLQPILACSDRRIAPHIIDVLRGDDEVWKYWLLAELVIDLDASVRELLMDEIVRIINAPTDGERAEEVHLAAADVMVLYSHERPGPAG